MMVTKVLAEGKRLRLSMASQEGIIARWGLKGSGIFWKKLARYFGISRPSVSQAIKRGKKFAKEDDVKLLS
jgi:DNA-binding transcriptional ArsR family regulator